MVKLLEKPVLCQKLTAELTFIFLLFILFWKIKLFGALNAKC